MIQLGRVGTISHAKAVHADGKLQVLTTFEDDAALAQNKKIRDSGMLDKGKLGLHEGEDIRLAISCPSTEQWALFRKKHPETYNLLTTRGQRAVDDDARMKGARQLQLLHPAWIVHSRL